jgi:hypothetical protein
MVHTLHSVPDCIAVLYNASSHPSKVITRQAGVSSTEVAPRQPRDVQGYCSTCQPSYRRAYKIQAISVSGSSAFQLLIVGELVGE